MTHPSDSGQSSAPNGLDADPAIPTLHEVVELPRYESAPDLPPTLADVDWAALERRIQDQLIGRLMQRTELMLGNEVRTTLKAVLDRTAEQLSEELQVTLAQLTRDLVARAVTEEITRMHEEIARRDADPDARGDDER